MSRVFRRYEILLPQRFNDGQPVPQPLFEATLQELRERFGGVSAEMQDIQGFSIHRGEAFTDEMVRLYVDVPDTAQNIEYFRQLKEELKHRFQQADIWLVTHPIEVL